MPTLDAVQDAGFVVVELTAGVVLVVLVVLVELAELVTLVVVVVELKSHFVMEAHLVLSVSHSFLSESYQVLVPLHSNFSSETPLTQAC